MKTNNQQTELHWWASSSGRIEIQLPTECVVECSHVGDCTWDVEQWQAQLALGLDRDMMIQELREVGAWDIGELNSWDNDELESRIIWIAACDIRDELKA